jgi:predicted TPR repeat methyltransferase
MDEMQVTADAEALTARVAALIDAGRTGAARPLLGALRRISPSPAIAGLAATLAMREGHLDLAQSELDAAIADAPEDASLRKLRADVRRQLGNATGAAADAADAVLLDPKDAAAKALLGVLLLEFGQAGNAAACLAEAVASEPANPLFRQGLAAAQEALGLADAAFQTLTAGIITTPASTDLRNEAALLAFRRRDFATAVRLAEEARRDGVADAACFGLKGHALASLDRHAEAADAYREALKLDPDNVYVRHLVAASGMLPGAKRAPADFLRTLFDDFADRFESHLVSLGYRIPGVMRRVMGDHPTIVGGGTLGPALDLGCGTGLVGLALSDLPIAPLVGVDVASRMLRHAAAKRLYAELHETDVLRFLADDSRQWSLVLAADVLIYFGVLYEVMAAVHGRLAPGGWFVFSLEELLADRDGVIPGNGDWALQRQGRYAHSIDYAMNTALACGFTIRALERQVVRLEANVPVAGVLAVLERRYDG